MKIALSFAVLPKNLEFNQKIEFLNQFKIDGIEVFGQELELAKLSSSTIKILKNYKENSIHMPNFGVYDSSQECKQFVERIINKAKKINAKKLVFHSHQIQNYKYIFQKGFVSAIENAPDGKKKIGLQTIKENKKILEAHKGLKLVFDPTHALVNSIMPKNFLALKDYIIAVQVSGISQIGGKTTQHLRLTQTPKEMLKLIKPVMDLNTTFIIESTISKQNSRKEIMEEIKFVKNKFNMS